MKSRKYLGIAGLASLSFGLMAGCSDESTSNPLQGYTGVLNADSLQNIVDSATSGATNVCLYDGYSAFYAADGVTIMCMDPTGSIAFWINADGTYGFPTATTDGTDTGSTDAGLSSAATTDPTVLPTDSTGTVITSSAAVTDPTVVTSSSSVATGCTSEVAAYTIGGVSYYRDATLNQYYYYDAQCQKVYPTVVASSSSVVTSSAAVATSSAAWGFSSAAETATSSSSNAWGFSSDAQTTTSSSSAAQSAASSSSWGIYAESSSSGAIGTGDKDDNDSDNEDAKTLDGTETLITVSGTSATIQNDNGCLVQDGNKLTITCSGSYYFTGTGSDYQVFVNVSNSADTENVGIYLYNLDMTSSSAPFIVVNAEKTVFHIVKGTTNKLTDGTGSHDFTKADGTADVADAVIYAKDDINFKGAGTLILKSNYITASDTGSGIKCSNDIKIKNGNITVTAQNNGIKGKGSVQISGGTLDITTTYGDGIKSDEDDATELANGKGYVEITGGTIKVTSAYDGISAANKLTVATGDDGDPTITIVAGGGQTCLGDNSSGMDGNSCQEDISKKGLKADSLILISGGNININSRDDAVHGGNVVTLEGGSLTIKSDDDGVHAEDSLNINGGTVNITKCYEGFEAGVITANGGTTSLRANDDGWNASASTSSTSSNMGWNMGGGMGGSSTGTIIVNGGYHYVSTGSGDTDGIDSNGDIYFHGGVMVIEAGGNGTDKGDNGNSLTLDGGVLIVFASQLEGVSTTCATASVSGQQLTVVQNNAVVASYTPSSSNTASIMTNGSATVYTGGTVNGNYVTFPYNSKNLYYSGTISGGTQVSTGTCSSSGMGGGGNQGGRGF